MKTLYTHSDAIRPIRRRTAGFTVLELIGVLAMLVILTCLVAESVLKRIKIASRTAEAASLRTMGAAFKSAVWGGRSLPASADALTLIGQKLAQTPAQVGVNPQGQNRVVLYDPALGIGGGAAPYTQGARGTPAVTSLRALVVSSLTDPLPNLSGATNFANVWATPPEILPAGWPATWTGEAADVLVERVDLRPLFCRVHLNNLDQTLIAKYAIDSTNMSTTLAANSTTNGWYFVSSPLLLFNMDGTLQVTEVLVEDTSYVYESGRWGRYLVSGKTKPAGTFGSLVDQFLNAPPPPPDSNQFGANQQAIVDEMYYYMWSYALWASDGFSKGGSSSAQHVPELRFIEDSSVRLTQVSNNILKQ